MNNRLTKRWISNGVNKKILLFNLVVGLLLVAGVAGAVTIDNPLNVNDFKGLIINITKVVAEIVGGVAIIMFLYAGILFLTSAGSPERITKARTALTYAIVGLVIALAAGGIVELIKQVTGAPP